MFKNYFKSALRNILKQKGFSFINITGLAIGMACCLLILMFVNDELSYDSYNEKAERIYRVAGSFSIHFVTTCVKSACLIVVKSGSWLTMLDMMRLGLRRSNGY